MNICSLLPSATEILFALGLGEQVKGVTHECDYPPEARAKPVLTHCAFDSDRMSPAQIDDEVRRLASIGASLYRIDEDLLSRLDPDLIVTQELCHVCAITPKEVDRALQNLRKTPIVLSLNPRLLDDVFADMTQIGHTAGIDARELIHSLRQRVEKITRTAAKLSSRTVGCVEWLDPLWRTGHWVPQMVQHAGGHEVLADPGKPSRSLDWKEMIEQNPEIVIIMPCGYDLMRTKNEFLRVRELYPWHQLKAFQSGQIYLVDANAYFSRSGPRLVDGLELLAEMLHPEYFKHTAPLNSYIRIS